MHNKDAKWNTKESPFGSHYNFQSCSTYVFQTLLFFSNLEHFADLRRVVVTDLQLLEISENIGRQWMELGYILDIKSRDISYLEGDNNLNQAYSLLIKWKQQRGDGATIGILVDALEIIGRNDLAQKVLGKMIFC